MSRATRHAPPAARRVYGYVRVSTIGQTQGTSLSDQRRAIEAHAGLKLDKVFAEAETGTGERAEKRVQMQALLREVQRGDLVLCYALDRWSRDIIFTHTTMRDLKARGVSVYFVADHLDPMTDAGELQLGFMAVGAQAEHRRIRQRLLGTRDRLRDDGYYSAGRDPLGYRRQAPAGVYAPNKNVLLAVEEEAAIVRRVFAMCAAGVSTRRIADQLDMKADYVLNVLHNRIYLGEIRSSSGQWRKARHEPIVELRTFAKAHEALIARRAGGPRPREVRGGTASWWLRDLARCAKCGARMRASYANERKDGTYASMYYRCAHKCGAKYVTVRLVEQDATHAVIGRLHELRHELKHPPAPAVMAAPKSLAEKLADVEVRRARLVDALEAGRISPAEFDTRAKKLDDARMKLDAEKPAAPLIDTKTRKALLTTIINVYRTWDSTPPARRREIVNLLAVSYHMADLYHPRETMDLTEYAHQIGFTWRAAEDLAVADIAAALSSE